jgi:hypothetical protein
MNFASLRIALVVVSSWSASAVGAAPIDFVRDVRPIFAKHCYTCHGAEKQKSALRLDIKSEAFRGGDAYGPAILPKNAAESPLIKLVSSADADERMPPEAAPLTKTEIATLTRWIDEGAAWPAGVDLAKLDDKRDHWSFKPTSHPQPPTIKNTAWPRTAIDRFILARLEAEQLQPAPQAERAAWLRRVSFDLVGLPPTPEQLAAFAADKRPDAYERVVDELLTSPRYGERWAQHWLDVVRYADTHGFEVNTERPNAWPYRDYVIEAFNADLPYDQFIREQIAGDTLRKDAATGFLITASVLLPAQIGADEPSKRLARQDALDEIVTNVGQTFLGLSIGCARCHDHKFDPISAREYYAMQAFVAGVEYGEREPWTPEIEARRREEQKNKAELDAIERQLKRYEKPDASPSSTKPMSSTKSLPPTKPLSPTEALIVDGLRLDRDALKAKLARAKSGQKVFAGVFRKPDVIRLLHRGDPEQPKEEVRPAVLAVLASATTKPLPAEASESERRVALAEWIASPANPLTARVMVNRIWQGHFGTGLVETASDFGQTGTKPSHPELLDWLAEEFIRSGWSVKAMHRLIVLSATYRQSSRYDAAAAARDADVRLLWRYPPRRLEAEAIRDAILFVAGRLDLKMGGRGFDLFDKRGGLSGFKPVESFTGDGLRRMIYAHKVRREREAVFGAFDCPDAGQSTARRRESNTPIQALNLFNSKFTLEQAQAMAERVKKETSDDASRQTARAYLLALGREPSSDELVDAAAVVHEFGLATLCRALFNSNEFLFVP